MKTYDILFSDDTSSDSLGFKETKEFCKNYIKRWNGSDHSYFKDYKTGTVCIVCNETLEISLEAKVK